MKRTSTYNFFVLAAFAIGTFGTVTFASCKKSDTNTTTPAVKDADKFVGSWTATGENTTYELTISAVSANEVKLSMLSMSDVTNVKATVSGNIITIPKQTISGGDFDGIDSGSGTYDPATKKVTISITFTNTNGNPPYKVNEVWIKK